MVRGLDAILETALYADDLVAAEFFYAGILGLDVIGRQERRHVFFRIGGAVLLVFNPTMTRIPPLPGRLPVPAHGAVGQGHVCFRLDRDAFDGWRERLESAGVEIEAEFDWPGGGRSLYVRDPAGNSVEFAEARIWGL